MAELGGDARLKEAHEKAVAETLKELEEYAATRVRQDGANEDRTTGNLVLAVYHHDTSRELDPQLHTHAVAGNLTWDGTEGGWKALQASDIYEGRVLRCSQIPAGADFPVIAASRAPAGHKRQHCKDGNTTEYRARRPLCSRSLALEIGHVIAAQ